MVMKLLNWRNGLIKAKQGNITSILLPIMFMIFISIIIATIFVYFQISIFLYDVKLNTFYIVQSSISDNDYMDLAYGDYTLNIKTLESNINNLYKQNYLESKNKTKGIVDINCYKVEVISKNLLTLFHTKSKYSVPIICVKYKIKFNPLISILGTEIEIKMHDDIKLSLLEFD